MDKRLKRANKKELFTVGEYWTGDVQKLHRYITETEGEISLFDVPLHYKLSSASKEENYDLSQLLDNTLVKKKIQVRQLHLSIIMILNQDKH